MIYTALIPQRHRTDIGVRCAENTREKESFKMEYTGNYIALAVPRTVTMSCTSFWDVAVCDQIEFHRCFGGDYCCFAP
jgi:hypothetical protein